MSSLPTKDLEALRLLLQNAVVKCSERCLYQSAKWVAELLTSLPPPEHSSPTDTEVDSPMSEDTIPSPLTVPGILSHNDNPREARLEAAEAHKYLLAKTYFDCREYDRCAAVFLPTTIPKGQMAPPPSATKQSANGKAKGKATAMSQSVAIDDDAYSHLSQKALFLSLYSKYMSGEKRKAEESEYILGPADGGATANKELASIARVLEARLQLLQDTDDPGQGWLEYLYGIVQAKSKNDVAAKEWLVKSLHLFPFNWGVWQELGTLIGSSDELITIGSQLPRNIMSYIFHIYANQELFVATEQVFDSLKEIKRVFPASAFLRTQKALLYYHAKDFEKAERIFSKTVQQDPHRIDDLDTYSNILYVMVKPAKLAFLAQLSSAVDKFRPETCCVVGNYYAMKSEHEKAVMYFRRALTLDRSFLSAWTLMGHEYVEMKNTQAAIECYRRAVDVNRKDYRAWYGLGQTYEVLEMHYYALHYYRRAAALSPYDPKMWTAVGSCFAKMNRPLQAVKAYKRALVAGSYYDSAGSSFGSQGQGRPSSQNALMDPEVLWECAKMFDKLGDADERKAYLELVLAQEEGPEAQAAEDEDSPAASLRRSMTSATGGSVGAADKQQGVGVTVTTSKARLWLCRIELAEANETSLRRARDLANELCQDGYEVEEAKGLGRQIRALMDAAGWV
ncbi:hypothetical protein FH972_024409 [Carpinus fangiana]|uniref:Cdc23 domain-containing protein n=1 Tax=Carpinus fangiana TaxID=176857 RepID=A0A5N6KYF9_9ROSI|nr:hypothetical protein FH972_024409 [Carpinus fangiana]